MKTNGKTKKMNAIKTPLFLADFTGKSEGEIRYHLVKNYEAPVSEVEKYDILIAYEEEGSWEGESHFLLRDRYSNELFEVHASHCSCHGFEDQFKPEATNAEYLLSDKSGWFCLEQEVKNHLREVLA